MILHAILAGLAGARVAMLLVEEMGPGDIFYRMRAAAGVPDVGRQAPRPFVGGVLSCVYCCSVWTSGAAWLVGWAWSWTAVGVVASMMAAIGCYRLAKGWGPR